MANQHAPLPGSPTGQVVATTTTGVFHGYNFRETGGSSPATAVVYSGSSDQGTVLASVTVAAGASVDFESIGGCAFTGGVYVVTSGSGTLAGFVRWQTTHS